MRWSEASLSLTDDYGLVTGFSNAVVGVAENNAKCGLMIDVSIPCHQAIP